ncbi:hypothetical protein RSAG8_09094, partial [Rhizoctonia solani AG-8 WAC10335]
MTPQAVLVSAISSRRVTSFTIIWVTSHLNSVCSSHFHRSTSVVMRHVLMGAFHDPAYLRRLVGRSTSQKAPKI